MSVYWQRLNGEGKKEVGGGGGEEGEIERQQQRQKEDTKQDLEQDHPNFPIPTSILMQLFKNEKKAKQALIIPEILQQRYYSDHTVFE